MVNILVPTDLSNLSKIAAGFAIKIANQLDANITFIHVLTAVAPVRAVLEARFKSLRGELLQRAEDEMIKTMKPVVRGVKFAAPIKYHTVIGVPFSNALRKESKKLRSGLIVMGTHGASGLRKVILGSNTTSMIAVSSIPVLAVPEHAAFKGFRNIVYATDMKNLKKELKLLIPYARIFGSTIHIVHVSASGNDVSALEEKMDGIVEKCGYDNVVNMVLADEDVDDAIDQYVSINKADLLAMFTHNPTFYERLFDRSQTRRMAFHSRVPLLAFKH